MNNLRTWIELSKKALRHNVDQMYTLCGTAMFGVVVKANAYGHGMLEIASLLENYPAVQWFFVAGTSEAIVLRKHGITKPILAMSYVDSNLDDVVQQDIACAVYTKSFAEKLHTVAKAAGKMARVHLKIDSNMSRLGVLSEECDDFFSAMMNMPALLIEGIFTHLSDTNNPDDTFTNQQLKSFDAVVARYQDRQQIPYQHVIASGSLLNTKKYDIVRTGTNIYGFWKSPFQQERFLNGIPQINLQPVLTWKTRIVAIYNTHSQKKAILPVGYYDGYPRVNTGYVLVGSNKSPLVDWVDINTMTIDITDIPHVKIGDEVVLVGSQPGVTATDIAQCAGTINNEIVTRIHAHIPRMVVE